MGVNHQECSCSGKPLFTKYHPSSSQLTQDRSFNASGNTLTQHQSGLLEMQARAGGAKLTALSAVVEGKEVESNAITLHQEVNCEFFFCASSVLSLCLSAITFSVETHQQKFLTSY